MQNEAEVLLVLFLCFVSYFSLLETGETFERSLEPRFFLASFEKNTKWSELAEITSLPNSPPNLRNVLPYPTEVVLFRLLLTKSCCRQIFSQFGAWSRCAVWVVRHLLVSSSVPPRLQKFENPIRDIQHLLKGKLPC